MGGGISGGRTPVRRRWLLGTSAWLAARKRPTHGSEVGRAKFPPLGQETRGFVGGFTYIHSVDVAEPVASCAIITPVSRVCGYYAALGRLASCCKTAPQAPPAAKAPGQATVVTANGGAAACRGRTGGPWLLADPLRSPLRNAIRMAIANAVEGGGGRTRGFRDI